MSNEHSPAARSRLLAEQAIGEAMGDLAQRNEARARCEGVRLLSIRERLARIGLAIALPIFMALLMRDMSSVRPFVARLIGPAVTRPDVQAALEDVVVDIEAFRADYGELPVSLAEIGLPANGDWYYARSSNGTYDLTVAMGGHTITFVR
jgi:hypothetical protein